MKRIPRHLPSPAMMVSLLAVFLALGGGSFAVASHLKVRASDIQKNAVRSKHIKNQQVRSADVKNDGLTGVDFRNDSLKGADIDEASLGKVPSAANADDANTANTATSAGSANTATNANRLGNLPAADYQRRCRDGAAKAFMRVKASSTFPSLPTASSNSAYVDGVFICGDGLIRVSRSGIGEYLIDLRNAGLSGSRAAQVTVEGTTSETVDDLATVDQTPFGLSGWTVNVRDGDGSARDTPFHIVIF